MRTQGINRVFSKNKWIRWFCVLGAFALCCVIVLVSNAPETHDIKVGEISTETITAPREFVDEEATFALQEEERAKIGPVYNMDTALARESLDALTADFANFELARAYAQQYYINTQIAALQAAENQRVQSEIEQMQADDLAEPGDLPTAKVIGVADVPFDPGSIDWQTYLPGEEQSHIREMLPAYLSDADWQTIVSMSKDGLSSLFNLVYGVCEEELAVGFKEENINEVIDRIVLKVSEQYGLTTQESELLVRSIQNDLQPNIVFDQEATRIKQDAAAEAVQPVIYKKGQNIVMKGEVVTPSQYAVLDSLGMLDQPASTIDYSLAAILYIALLFAVYVIYVLNFEKKLAENVKHIAILSILDRFGDGGERYFGADCPEYSDHHHGGDFGRRTDFYQKRRFLCRIYLSFDRDRFNRKTCVFYGKCI